MLKAERDGAATRRLRQLMWCSLPQSSWHYSRYQQFLILERPITRSARDVKDRVDLMPFEVCNQPTRVLGGDGCEIYAPITGLLDHLGHDR
jgi:hypothetical protein